MKKTNVFDTTKADIFKKLVDFCADQDPYDVDMSQGSESWYDLLKIFNEEPHEIISQLIDIINELQG